MSEELTVGDTYAGTFTKVLDPKRRITIPAKWRFKGDEGENSYLAILARYGQYSAILVMPPDMAAQLRSKISKIPITNVAKRRALANFLQNACTFGCDKQGRIMLDESILAKAGIEREVCMAGMGANFELWNPAHRTEWLGESPCSRIWVYKPPNVWTFKDISRNRRPHIRRCPNKHISKYRL